MLSWFDRYIATWSSSDDDYITTSLYDHRQIGSDSSAMIACSVEVRRLRLLVYSSTSLAIIFILLSTNKNKMSALYGTTNCVLTKPYHFCVGKTQLLLIYLLIKGKKRKAHFSLWRIYKKEKEYLLSWVSAKQRDTFKLEDCFISIFCFTSIFKFNVLY